MHTKVYTDYIDQIHEKYPKVSKKDIKRIMRYFWKSIYLTNTYGCDAFLTDSNIWVYMGFLRKNSLEHFAYYRTKLARKLRILYKRKKIQWDGYYYFSLSSELYQNYIDLKKKRGRPRKYFSFGNIVLFKILGECQLYLSGNKYIFRVPYAVDVGEKFYVKDFKTDKAELIETREPLKFSDILITNNDYGFL